jgi:hypothetical protein
MLALALMALASEPPVDLLTATALGLVESAFVGAHRAWTASAESVLPTGDDQEGHYHRVGTAVRLFRTALDAAPHSAQHHVNLAVTLQVRRQHRPRALAKICNRAHATCIYATEPDAPQPDARAVRRVGIALPPRAGAAADPPRRRRGRACRRVRQRAASVPCPDRRPVRRLPRGPPVPARPHPPGLSPDLAHGRAARALPAVPPPAARAPPILRAPPVDRRGHIFLCARRVPALFPAVGAAPRAHHARGRLPLHAAPSLRRCVRRCLFTHTGHSVITEYGSHSQHTLPPHSTRNTCPHHSPPQTWTTSSCAQRTLGCPAASCCCPARRRA